MGCVRVLIACNWKIASHNSHQLTEANPRPRYFKKKKGHFILHLQSVKIWCTMCISFWTNVSNKSLETIILTYNNPFLSSLCGWAAKILYFKRNYNVYCLLLLDRSFCIFPLSITSATSMILVHLLDHLTFFFSNDYIRYQNWPKKKYPLISFHNSRIYSSV